MIREVKGATSTAVVRWNAVAGATGYDLYQSINNASFVYLGKVTSTTVSQGNLTPGAYVRYRVRATASGRAASDLSAAKGLTIPQPRLSTPVIREVKGATTSIVVRWNTVANATGY